MLNRFYVNGKITAVADSRLKNGVVLSLFRRFTYETSALEIQEGECNTFMIGDVKIPSLQKGCDYSLVVNENGVAIVGRDYGALMRGYCSMLMKIEREPGKRELFISSACESKIYGIQNRMIHFCVFPETTLSDLKKYVRLSALLQYTHVVIEFWGTLKLDTLPSLAWDSAYTKDEIKEILSEAKMLGIEPIPMFNSLGHATGARAWGGKHVVLDNEPSLYYLFTPDGWAWDLENEEVWTLLKSIRGELYELFEGCEYFHLGLDESHAHSKNPMLSEKLPHYLSRLTKEIQEEGKRPMIWMDMLLPPDAFVNMEGNAHSVKSREECIRLIRALADNTVFIDWEYSVKQAPISSTLYFKELGIDLMGASWFDTENAYAHIDTVVDNDLFGFMQTTWHTVASNLSNLIPIADRFGASLPVWKNESTPQTILATLLRALTFEKKDYHSCGWVKSQLS